MDTDPISSSVLTVGPFVKPRFITIYCVGNSGQCYVAAWMGGEFGAEWIHVRTWLSPFAVHLKTITNTVNHLYSNTKILCMCFFFKVSIVSSEINFLNDTLGQFCRSLYL